MKKITVTAVGILALIALTNSFEMLPHFTTGFMPIRLGLALIAATCLLWWIARSVGIATTKSAIISMIIGGVLIILSGELNFFGKIFTQCLMWVSLMVILYQDVPNAPRPVWPEGLVDKPSPRTETRRT